MSTKTRVHESFMDLIGRMQDPPNIDSTLEYLTASAIKSIPGFAAASVSVRESDQQIKTLAPTSDLADQVDQLQYELREGPCYDVISGARSTIVTFMADEDRWPNFAPAATRLGVGSMMSFELADRPEWRAGLNLYAAQGGSLEPEALDTAELFAAHAAVTLGFVRKIEQLEAGLRTRSVIGQAVGMLMQRYTLTHDRAFEFLVRLSQDTNVKLRDIASDYVEEWEQKANHQASGHSR